MFSAVGYFDSLILGAYAYRCKAQTHYPRNPPVVVMSQAERDFCRRLEELRTTEPPPRKYITQ